MSPLRALTGRCSAKDRRPYRCYGGPTGRSAGILANFLCFAISAFFRCWCTFKKETKKKEKILQRAAMLQELERRRGGSAAVFFIVIL